MYRRKLGKSKVNNIHRFVSFKNSSTILTESALEFDSCYPLEYNRNIIAYEAQPEGFEYIYQDEIHSYTPDFSSKTTDGKKPYIEVKPSKITKRKDFMHRFQCMREGAMKVGQELLLLTEESIRSQPYLNNLKILHRYRTHDPISPEQRVILATVSRSTNKQITLNDLIVRSDIAPSLLLPLTYDLIARNELLTNLNTIALSRDSLVGIHHDGHPKVY